MALPKLVRLTFILNQYKVHHISQVITSRVQSAYNISHVLTYVFSGQMYLLESAHNQCHVKNYLLENEHHVSQVIGNDFSGHNFQFSKVHSITVKSWITFWKMQPYRTGPNRHFSTIMYLLKVV